MEGGCRGGRSPWQPALQETAQSMPPDAVDQCVSSTTPGEPARPGVRAPPPPSRDVARRTPPQPPSPVWVNPRDSRVCGCALFSYWESWIGSRVCTLCVCGRARGTRHADATIVYLLLSSKRALCGWWRWWCWWYIIINCFVSQSITMALQSSSINWNDWMMIYLWKNYIWMRVVF